MKRNWTVDRRKDHKGETGAGDAPRFNPNTTFLTAEHVEMWRQKVEEIRQGDKSTRGTKRKVATPKKGGKDIVEPKMLVPKSVLDGCEGAYIAADGSRVKASSRFFADTGCMALLCSHDHVLFNVNMQTPGEQQFHVYALLDALLQQLPSWWKLGLLYDVGCQTHRSFAKWNYIPEWEDRFYFGVAVFHAYGHQWACQLWYHPRKREIWGHRDGEGCERYWFDIQLLIPVLRVTGYHRRIYIIDMQVEHITRTKYQKLGEMLQARIHRTASRLRDAEASLAKTPFTIPYLLDQFKQQREYQSKPVERRSKSKATKAVESLITLTGTLETLKRSVRNLHEELNTLANTPGASLHLLRELHERIKAQETTIKLTEESVQRKTSIIRKDQDQSLTLDQIKGNGWLNDRLNLRVIKSQITAKLLDHKHNMKAVDKKIGSRVLGTSGT